MPKPLKKRKKENSQKEMTVDNYTTTIGIEKNIMGLMFQEENRCKKSIKTQFSDTTINTKQYYNHPTKKYK